MTSSALLLSTLMAVLNIQATPIFHRAYASRARIVVHEGGTSSSKTWSTAQKYVALSFEEERKLYSVLRKTFPALRRSALEDFKQALAASGAEGHFTFNKSDGHVYTNTQTGTRIEFFAADNAQKLRGPRRDRLWTNEANELLYEDFYQAIKRTRGQVDMDYNPSFQRHWIPDKVLVRDDVELIRSTYLDNPYLEAEVVQEIERDVPVYQEAGGELVYDWELTYQGEGRLVAGDPERWAVYGLGRRGRSRVQVYPDTFDSPGIPEGARTVIGLDLGWTHPTVALRIGYHDAGPSPDNPLGVPELHFDQLVHESHLHNEDLAERLYAAGVEGGPEGEVILADAAAAQQIAELRALGLNVHPATKGPGSVAAGIKWMKRHRLCFTARSAESRAQFEGYRFALDKRGEPTDVPVKLDDDAPDAGRYGAHGAWGPVEEAESRVVVGQDWEEIEGLQTVEDW